MMNFQQVDQMERDRLERIRIKQSDYTRRYYNSAARGASLPALQAVISGAFLGLLGGFGIGILVDWIDYGSPWRAGLIAGVLTMLLTIAFVWFRQLEDWRELVWSLESSLAVDLDRDGIKGDPDQVVNTVRVELVRDEGRRVQIADIPTDPARLADFARGILDGQPISERQWSGAGALFSQNEFRAVRDAFMARGWLRWVDARYPQQGIELSPAGRAALRGLAGVMASPTPSVHV